MKKEIFSEIICERYSCRNFKERMLTQEEMDYILESREIIP